MIISGHNGEMGPLYQDQYNRYETWVQETGKENVDFLTYVQVFSRDINTQAQMWENEIEGGDDGDGVKGNTLNVSKHLKDGTKGITFQTEGNEYVDIDLQSGRYQVLDNEDLAAQYNVDEEAIDIIDMDFDSLNFINYSFEGLEDGKADRARLKLSEDKNVNFTYQEVDTTNPEGVFHVANMFENKFQWDFANNIKTPADLFKVDFVSILKGLFK